MGRQEPEPKAVTRDVAAVLKQVIKPEQEDAGESVALIAHRADTSTRTVYRVISDPPNTEEISLDLADRLCLAADTHPSHYGKHGIRLVFADGTIRGYLE